MTPTLEARTRSYSTAVDANVERTAASLEIARGAHAVTVAVAREVAATPAKADGWDPGALAAQVDGYVRRVGEAHDEVVRLRDDTTPDTPLMEMDLAFTQSTGAMNGARILAAHAVAVAEYAVAMKNIHTAR